MPSSSTTRSDARPRATTDEVAAREGLAHRPRFGVIAIEGPDRAAFLQGQLTQDVRGLEAGNSRPAAGLTAQPFKTPGGNTVSSFILQPTPLTADNLQLAVDGGQITKAELCKGVDAATAPAACK